VIASLLVKGNGMKALLRSVIAWSAGAAALLILSGCVDMSVRPQLDMGGGGKKVEVKSNVLAVGSLDFSPDGRLLVSAGVQPMLRVWDVANARGLRALPFPETAWGVGDVAISPDGKRVAASGMAGLLGPSVTQVWDIDSGKALGTIGGDFGGYLSFTGDGKFLIGQKLDFGGLFENPHNNVLKLALPGGEAVQTYGKARLGAISRDQRHMLLMKELAKGAIMVDVASGTPVWETTDRYVSGIAFVGNGRHVISSHVEYQGMLGSASTISLILRDVANGQQVREVARYTVGDTLMGIEKDKAELKVLVPSPDGRVMISGNNRGEYKLWDATTWQVMHELKRPAETMVFGMSPAHAAFSPDGSRVAVTYAGTVRLYGVADGKELAAMVAFDDGEWLVTTPSGYYTASEKGDDYLSVQVAGKALSISQLRESFFRPDLVKLALAGEGLQQFRQVAELKPPPSVAIVDTPTAVSSPALTLSLVLSDQGGGIGDVRLYRNGTAVVQAGARNLGVAEGKTAGQRVSYTVPLEPGHNRIRAIAFNADNSIQSTEASIDVEASIVSRPPALHAVVVGIKEFANPRLALRYSVADAELFADTLAQRAGGLFSSVNVVRLTTPAQTTKASIVEALHQAKTKVGPEDLFVFYVASHGTVDDGQYLLITSNVGSTMTARLKQDALTQDALKELIANVPASKKLVVLDTCNAGQLGDAIQVAVLTRGMSDDTAMKVLSRAVGSTVLSAATSVQEAFEGYRDHGLFTYVIAEGLNGAADSNKDGFVKTLELADYVDAMVPELAERVFKHRQYPIVSPTGQGFPIGKVR